jgi:hypothetical protein
LFEEQMYESILSFIQKEGYLPFVQIPHLSGRIDFVGIKDSECLIIEGKVNKWKNGLKQALKYGYGAEEAYVALPDPIARNVAKRHGKTFEKYGVGIIEAAEAASIVLSCERRMPSPVFKQIILNEVQRRKCGRDDRVSMFKGRLRK